MKPFSYVYLAFFADSFDTEAVTSLLGIAPTAIRHKQYPRPTTTSWEYRIIAEDAIDLEAPLAQIIDLFGPKAEAINQLKRALNLESLVQFVITIDMREDASTPYFGLDSRTIEFLAKTGTAVDFDLYKSD